ncbi:MAG: hypothetical protein Fur0018_26260 [Anaerolineales bacterium]
MQGTRLLVLSGNGALQAFEAQTGALLWLQRLEDTPRQLFDFAGRPALLTQQEETLGLNVYALEDGTLKQRIIPQCPNDPFPENPQTLDARSSVFTAPDHQSVYFVFGFLEPGCIQRWDAGQDAPRWQVTFPVENLPAIPGGHWLITPQYLAFTKNNSLYAVELIGGDFHEQVLSQDYNIFPLSAADNGLLLQAGRKRGSRRSELWYVDSQTWKLLWTYLPDAEAPLDTSLQVIPNTGQWYAVPTAKGVAVFQFFPDPFQVKMELVNTASGGLEQQQTLHVPAPPDAWMQFVAWEADEIWLSLTNHLVDLDTATNQVRLSWP